MPGPTFQHVDEDLSIAALRDLVAAILRANYRDANGVGLRNSIAFLQAKALVDLHETLGTAGDDAN